MRTAAGAAAGPSSLLFNAVSQASAALPPAALATQELLRPTQTWLSHENCRVAEAQAHGLSAAHTLACWLAAHSPHGSVAQPAAPGPALTPVPPPVTVALQSPLPWGWLAHASPAAAAQGSPEEQGVRAEEGVRHALHSRLLELSPGDAMLGVEAHSSAIAWPQHSHEILSALHTPLDARGKRGALRPLFVIAEAAMMQPGARDAGGSRRLVSVGHVLGLMDLANVSGAALTPHSSDAVRRFLGFACEELQARTAVLSAHEIASSVLMLGEILGMQVRGRNRSPWPCAITASSMQRRPTRPRAGGCHYALLLKSAALVSGPPTPLWPQVTSCDMQGTYSRLRCDPAHAYLAGLFCSDAVQALRFTSMQRMMLCSGIQRLFGSRMRSAWCSPVDAHLAPVRADPSARRTRVRPPRRTPMRLLQARERRG